MFLIMVENDPNWKQEDEMRSMLKIRRFIYVSYFKNRD